MAFYFVLSSNKIHPIGTRIRYTVFLFLVMPEDSINFLMILAQVTLDLLY